MKVRTIINKKNKKLNDWESKVEQFENELLECRLKQLNIVYKLDARGAPEPIIYNLPCEGFQSIDGIPDEFMSAEDPADRSRLYK